MPFRPTESSLSSPAPPGDALAFLDGLTRALSHPGDLFRSVGDAVLQRLAADGTTRALLFAVLEDGRVVLLAQAGVPAGLVARAEAAFDRAPALAALAGVGDPLGFRRDAPAADADWRHVIEQLGQASALAAPLERELDRRGLLLLASDERDLTQPAWLAFARELAAAFARTVAVGDTLSRLREMADNLHEAVWLRTPDRTRVLYVNGAYERVFGVSAEAVLESPESWWVVAHPEDRARLLGEVATRPPGPFENSFRIVHPERGVRWIRSRAVPTFDSTGEISLYVGVAEDVTAAKEAEERLVAARNELEALSRRLVLVQEEERRALARELHDEFGQALTALRINLEVGTKTGRTPDLVELAAQVNGLLARVQDLTLDLRPTILDELGLVQALLWHFERFEKQAGIVVAFRRAGMEQRCSPGTEITAYRVIQEALTNVARHAGARTARVDLRADDTWLEIEIADEGRGFDPARPGGPATGLTGMRERALLAGGTLAVDSSPGKGTRIRARLPRRRAEAGTRGEEAT